MRHKGAVPLLTFYFAILLLVAAPSGNALAAPRKSLAGHVPQVVAALPSTGSLPGGNRLPLAIGLPLRDPQTLSNLLQAIYDPASPQYRHYLTPEQFTEKFGPTPGDYQALVNFAKASGFAVTATHSDRMLLDVAATVKDIEAAFQLSLRLYPHPTEARSFFAPDVEPSIPSDLRVSDICGLNNYRQPHPKIWTRPLLGPAAKNTSRDGSGPNGNLIGTDYRAAYVPGVALTGAGQIVGLLEFDNFYPNDLISYENQAHLTNPPPVQTLLLYGYDGTQSGGNGEVALDIEVTMAMAPELSQIIVYETQLGTPANDLLSVMATNTLVKQFSCSWDFSSNPRTTMDGYFQKMAAQGQSFFNASGDSGAYGGSIPEPDDDPYITQVGGTTLSTSSPGSSWLAETTWNSPGINAASSGGISPIYLIPPWQSGVATAANQASTTYRNVPDVAMVADNIFIVADDGLAETSGGTSVASPLWTAFTALANQQAMAGGLASVGFINPALYALYKTSAYSADFDDIAFGNNDVGGGGFLAGPGYDLCTGLGAPSGASLLFALASPDGFIITPGRGFAANGPSGGPFDVSAQTLLLTNAAAGALSWALGGLPAWLTASADAGALPPGGPSASVTLSLNSLARTMAPGDYAANLWFTNLASGLAQPRQVTLQVAQNLVHDGGFESADFCYWTLTGLDATNYNFVDDGSYTGYSPHSGLYFAALGQVNSLAYVSQSFPALTGQPCLISFWLENPSGLTPNQFTVEWDTAGSTNVLFNQTNMAAFGWKNTQLLALAPAATPVLRFGTRNDNEFFALDDTSVVPVPLPTIQNIQRAGGAVAIFWTALSGLVYQVQVSSDLLQPQWLNLGSPITATSNTATASENIVAGAQQFYRITLLLHP